MEISLPLLTAATMPQPQEQKLHEVVYSFTLASFSSCAAALTVGMLRIPLTARPAPALRVSFSMSLRLTTLFSACELDCAWVESSLLSGFLRSMRHTPGVASYLASPGNSEILHQSSAKRTTILL